LLQILLGSEFAGNTLGNGIMAGIAKRIGENMNRVLVGCLVANMACAVICGALLRFYPKNSGFTITSATTHYFPGGVLLSAALLCFLDLTISVHLAWLIVEPANEVGIEQAKVCQKFRVAGPSPASALLQGEDPNPLTPDPTGIRRPDSGPLF
jgi:hypothetical protein